MDFDALDALRSAGHPVELLSHAQQQVLAGLDQDQVAVLNLVKRGLDAVDPDVSGQELKLL